MPERVGDGLVLLRASELVDTGAHDALPPNWGLGAFRAAGRRSPNLSELGAPEAHCGDPHRLTATTAESLYAALGKFVAEEGACLLRF